MNYPMVGRLIMKDWHFARGLIATSVLVGLVMLLLRAALRSTGSEIAPMVTIVLFYGVLNALIWLPIYNVTGERRSQTLAFLMSLPITIREYTLAKIIGNFVLFLVPWTVLGLAAIGYIAAVDAVPDAYIPITAILLVQLLALFCLILATALVSESQTAVQAVGITSNIVYWFSWSFIGAMPGIGLNPDPVETWRTVGVSLVVGHLAAILVILALTLYLQSRKRDFI
jgi:ABC-2 type transport system permease protein